MSSSSTRATSNCWRAISRKMVMWESAAAIVPRPLRWMADPSATLWRILSCDNVEPSTATMRV
eukprot:4276270-Prymnesium_polylepis.2